MTKNERWLLSAAKEAQDYLARKIAGKPVKGMYEDITVARTLTAAIAAVEADQVRELVIAADEDDQEADDAEGDVAHDTGAEEEADPDAWSGGFADNH